MPKSEPISFRLEEEEKERLDAACREEMRSRANLITKALAEYYERHHKGEKDNGTRQ